MLVVVEVVLNGTGKAVFYDIYFIMFMKAAADHKKMQKVVTSKEKQITGHNCRGTDHCAYGSLALTADEVHLLQGSSTALLTQGTYFEIVIQIHLHFKHNGIYIQILSNFQRML